MPVAKVMALYGKYSGESFLNVPEAPPDLDVTASRTGEKVFVHVINTNRTQARPATLAVAGMTIRAGTSFTIAADPTFEIIAAERDPMRVREGKVDVTAALSFPAASVTALELDVVARV
jgi:alpha-L-arabinofuranosidase